MIGSSTSRRSAFAPTSRSRTGVDGVGGINRRPAPRCTPTVDASVGRGLRLLRRRGEYLERRFAHTYDTGGMRRTHLRGHGNILKRLLVHIGGFNLGLLMRTLIGVGTPRGLQGRLLAILATLWPLIGAMLHRKAATSQLRPLRHSEQSQW
jgi:hypothetical protein